MKSSTVFVDPPSGWMYGFPCEIKSDFTDDDYIALLRAHRYPEADIPLALRHSRVIGIDRESYHSRLRDKGNT